MAETNGSDTVMNIPDDGLAAYREQTNIYTELLPSEGCGYVPPVGGYALSDISFPGLPARCHGHASPRSSRTWSYLSYIRASCRRPFLNHRHHSRRQRGRRRHGHRKESESSRSSDKSRGRSSSRQNNRTLKTFLVAVCLLNLCLLLVVANSNWCIFYCKNADADELNTSFKLCTKCQPLEAKTGSAGGLINEIRSSKYPDFCCFRRVDQILALFDEYIHGYVDQEVFNVRKAFQNASNSAVTSHQNVDFRPKSLAHLYYRKPEAIDGDLRPLTWETRGIDIVLGQGMKVNRKSHLEVVESGYYYVYSHLTVKVGKQMAHQIYKNFETGNRRKLLSQTHSQDDTSLRSELVGVFKMKKSETLSVLAICSYLVDGERKNYFGAFKISD